MGFNTSVANDSLNQNFSCLVFSSEGMRLCTGYKTEMNTLNDSRPLQNINSFALLTFVSHMTNRILYI